jgi:hypothetical protein
MTYGVCHGDAAVKLGHISNLRVLVVAGVLLIHSALLGWIGYAHAPMYDEIAHLPAGISHWQLGSFDLYRVNPPLPRMVAGIPVLLAGAKTDWSGLSSAPFSRSEFDVGTRFTEINAERSLWLFTLARWTCIPFSILGGWICYRWATELFGFASGIVALVLWCFCPNILAWGATITPDAPAAALGVSAGYSFWCWLRKPNWRTTGIAGIVLGLAELTKGTWIVLFALWPCVWLAARVIVRPEDGESSRWREAGQLATILLLGVYLINLGYGFEGSFQRLGEFDFISATLGGEPARRLVGNRFRDSISGMIPVPLPANYVRGIDVQKFDFEVGKWSYLRGEQKLGGWYYYYIYALAIKTPLGTLSLGALAIVLALASIVYRRPLRDELVLFVPAVSILVLVSSQTGFNRYLRYLLPAVPFIFVSISRVGKTLGTSPIVLQAATVVLLASSVIGSLGVFPHSMSYFNLLAGGPRGGPAHLLDANIDWGQDLLYLKKWLGNHPEASPFHLQYFGFLNPKVAGIDALPVPACPTLENESLDRERAGPRPGWHAVSVNDIYGYRHYGQPREQYTYFQKLEPVAMAGYSIYIYHVSVAEANRVRRDLGLPPLEVAAGSNEM